MNLSLSPEKFQFSMNGGNFLEHFLSKEGIHAYPNKITILIKPRVPPKEKYL